MKNRLLILTLTLCCFAIQAQVLTPIEWEVSLSHDDPKVGEEVTIRFAAKIQKDWYLYSSDFDPELGPLVTTFEFEPHASYRLSGDLQPVDPLKKYDSLWEGEYTYFKKTALFQQKVVVTQPDFYISGSYLYQVCSDIDGKCIPFDDTFTLGTPPPNEISETSAPTKEEDGSIWKILFSAFLAGLVALLTPCVYPMIPITVSIFLKQSKSKKEGIIKAGVYGISIIFFFSLLGFAISWLWGFTALNELSTHWLFNLSIFTVFVLFALSFFGLFEINLPSGLINRIDRQADKGGFLGIFFMAITLVLVSFSCTFPIVGTALINTLNGGDILQGTAAMFGFSLAFAIPFTGFAIFPAWLTNLPQSGGWLNTVKVILGFLELALALKFLSIADLAYHWGLLDRDIFIACWILIFGAMGVYLLRKVRTNKQISVGKMLTGLAAFSVVAYLIPGLWGAPLKAISGFLPPVSTLHFNLYEKKPEGTLCKEPRHATLLKWPENLKGYFDYEQAIACARAQGKPLFIDFTGHGCVNCREMEQRVWSDEAVRAKLSSSFVLVALYVDDRTLLPEDEWYTSTYDGKLKKTIGQQNADFQITQFNNNAQPYYLLLSEDEKLLAPPRAYDLSIPAFLDFLETGLQNHRKGAFLLE